MWEVADDKEKESIANLMIKLVKEHPPIKPSRLVAFETILKARGAVAPELERADRPGYFLDQEITRRIRMKKAARQTGLTRSACCSHGLAFPLQSCSGKPGVCLIFASLGIKTEAEIKIKKMQKNQLLPQNPFPMNMASFPADLVTYYGIKG